MEIKTSESPGEIGRQNWWKLNYDSGIFFAAAACARTGNESRIKFMNSHQDLPSRKTKIDTKRKSLGIWTRKSSIESEFPPPVLFLISTWERNEKCSKLLKKFGCDWMKKSTSDLWLLVKVSLFGWTRRRSLIDESCLFSLSLVLLLLEIIFENALSAFKCNDKCATPQRPQKHFFLVATYDYERAETLQLIDVSTSHCHNIIAFQAFELQLY